MKVILLKDSPGIGRKYEVKNVSNGYARNFLIPRNVAKEATPRAIQEIEISKQRAGKETKIQQDLLEKNIDGLQNLRVDVSEKANEKGHLFASISAKDISKILKEQHHLEIPEEIIELEKPIKEIGEYKIKAGDKEFILIVTSNM